MVTTVYRSDNTQVYTVKEDEDEAEGAKKDGNDEDEKEVEVKEKEVEEKEDKKIADTEIAAKKEEVAKVMAETGERKTKEMKKQKRVKLKLPTEEEVLDTEQVRKGRVCGKYRSKLPYRTKLFGGQNFRQQVRFSAVLSAEILSDKVTGCSST